MVQGGGRGEEARGQLRDPVGRNLLCLDHARVSIRDAIPNQRHAGRHPCILFLYTLLQLRGICVISKLIFLEVTGQSGVRPLSMRWPWTKPVAERRCHVECEERGSEWRTFGAEQGEGAEPDSTRSPRAGHNQSARQGSVPVFCQLST